MQQNLTEREKELMKFLVTGMTNTQLAKEMIISVHTIKSMLENLFHKFNVHSRLELVVSYLKKDD